ncbi:alpha/beta hydrolase [Periweissella fabalis]|uniref:Alpha/beta hydrolase n=1 Tax=Periweissella fabalis TaxID=1070421 RepID=A0A7X6S3G6_9LACO|nr:alpha/beta hydrolase [Periweissella fabalis]MCM0598405.1 alpha/beta hydrolase [Periweissella fabalis]NKZ23972.1 alpha/beta hydrolase [Periweissella fabalis]
MLFIEKPYEFTPVMVPDEVVVSTDISYMDGQRHTLDIYQPSQTYQGLRPVIIDIYGGGLYFGEKSSFKLQNSLKLIKSGYVVISPDYSLIWQQPFPTQIYEIKAVIRWVREHAAKYQLDPNRIILSGESSGAHLAVLTAVTASRGMMSDTTFGMYPDQPETVQAVIASYGPYQMDVMPEQFEALGIAPKFPETGAANSFEGQMFNQRAPKEVPELVAQYNPVTYFNAAMPPMLILAGTDDHVVPVLQSQNLAVTALQVLPAAQVACWWVNGGDHGPADFANDEVLAWKIAHLEQWGLA